MPQERLERLGPGALSEAELLAMLLRSGCRGRPVQQLSRELLKESGGWHGLLSWTGEDFRRFPGIGRVKSLQLLTVLEVAKRILSRNEEETPELDTPAAVWKLMQPRALGLEVEKLWILCCSRRNRLKRVVEVTSGTATASMVHPREVFREAIRMAAVAVICVHNHPSGDPAPSAADIRTTRQLREASQTIGIDLTDHIILGHPSCDPKGCGYFSFSEAGLL